MGPRVPRPRSPSRLQHRVKAFNLGRASALGALWLVLILVLIMVYVRVSERGEPDRDTVAPATTVALIGIFAFGPVYSVLVTAFTPTHDVFRFPPRFIPDRMTSNPSPRSSTTRDCCDASPTA